MSEWNLEDLLQRGESKELDFKGPMKWDPKNNKGACCDLVKDILAMANTHGGRLVIGVREEPAGIKVIGLTDDEAKTWDSSKVNPFLAKYASSPINTTLVKRDYQGAVCVVIDVPAFPRMPHLCTRDYPGILRTASLYIRTDNNESAEITSVEHHNNLLERALRNRADELLRQVRTVLVGAQIDEGPEDAERFISQIDEAEEWFDSLYAHRVALGTGYLQATSRPSQFSESRISRGELRNAAWAANLSYRDWMGLLVQSYPAGPHAIQEGIEDSIEDLGGDRGRFYGWRLYQSGLLFHRQVIPDDVQLGANTPWGEHQPGENISIERLGAFVAITVDTTNALFTSLGVNDEDVTVNVEVLGAQNRRLRVPANWTLIDSQLQSHVQRIHAKQANPLEEWVAGNVDHALELANDLMSLFNLQTSYRRDKIEEVFKTRRR